MLVWGCLGTQNIYDFVCMVEREREGNECGLQRLDTRWAHRSINGNMTRDGIYEGVLCILVGVLVSDIYIFSSVNSCCSIFCPFLAQVFCLAFNLLTILISNLPILSALSATKVCTYSINTRYKSSPLLTTWSLRQYSSILFLIACIYSYFCSSSILCFSYMYILYSFYFLSLISSFLHRSCRIILAGMCSISPLWFLSISNVYILHGSLMCMQLDDSTHWV